MRFREAYRWMVGAAVFAAVIGLGTLAVGGAIDRQTALRAYLAGLLAWTMVPLGGFAILAIHTLTGGRWGARLMPALQACVASLRLVALLFVPVVMGLGHLYPWAGETVPQGTYLTEGAFLFRNVAYFALWIGLAWMLRPDQASLRTQAAAASLIVYALTATLAAVDWGMSLDPKFDSSIYGLLFMAHQMVAGLAFVILVGVASPGRVDPRDIKAWSALLLGALLVWGYVAFMQYLVIWSGDLPHKIEWYLARNEPPWGGVFWVVALLHGVVPFLVLIWSRFRRNPVVLGAVALVVLASGFLEMAWFILPAYGPGGAWEAVLNMAALLGIGGLWCAAVFRWLIRQERSPNLVMEEDHG